MLMRLTKQLPVMAASRGSGPSGGKNVKRSTWRLGAATFVGAVVAVSGSLTTLPASADETRATALVEEARHAAESVGAEAPPLPLVVEGDSWSSDHEGLIVEVPRDPSQAVSLRYGTDEEALSGIDLVLPLDAHQSEAVRVGSQVAYMGGDEGVDFVVSPASNGFQVISVLADASADHSIAYEIGLTSGESLRLEMDGSVAVVDAVGQVTGVFEKPWAVDAVGREISTRFEVDAGQLVQVIDSPYGAVYPISADPRYSVCTPLGFSVGLCSTLTRSETIHAKRLLDQYGAPTAGFIGTLCGIAGPVSWRDVTKNRIRAVCAAALAWYSGSLANAINSAYSSGRCLRIIMYTVPGNVGAFNPTRVVRC